MVRFKFYFSINEKLVFFFVIVRIFLYPSITRKKIERFYFQFDWIMMDWILPKNLSVKRYD